ncbi:MCE family protein [uncultured Mycolicibacterium sp.]|uniref:MCE family protein n=1 Tax=uncultured Mycolicibacterium sp. TaxID=2320817 RepID=UPI002601773B|nr:MCE family protein [uncultured Mycolicibacterium sp.]
MLTRFVRNQLIIFTIASVVGVAVMVFTYMQVPMLLGIGRITVTLELPAGGGLYRFSNVTYRGVQVGKVQSVSLTDDGARAVMSLAREPRIPADLRAEVRSMSAVGEQYVELLPNTDAGPYLEDGAVIPRSVTSVPQQVGPMLEQLNALVQTIPKESLTRLLDEAYAAFNGTGYDFASLVDSSAVITRDARATAGRTRALTEDAEPFLEAQARTSDAIRTWAAALSGITGQLAQDDPQVRTILREGPGFAQETSRLLEQVRPTLPVLLANMATFGRIGVVYNPSIEQLLVLVPPFVAQVQTYLPMTNPTGIPLGDFSLGLGDPPACTVGFLPPSSWRSPADLSIVDTPDNLYCKLPQDSPIAVRGARNYPCMEHPGKRAPTVELCNDPVGFQPLAQRQHALGPYPFDPNLVGQGVPIDSRAALDDNTFGPIEGTPLPPGVTAPPPQIPRPPSPPPNYAGTNPGSMLPGQPLYVEPPVSPPGPEQVLAPDAVPLPPAQEPKATQVPVPHGISPEELHLPPGYEPVQQPAPVVSPSSAAGGSGPSVGVAKYNPRTGEYLGSDGKLYRQADLVGAPKRWQEMLPT